MLTPKPKTKMLKQRMLLLIFPVSEIYVTAEIIPTMMIRKISDFFILLPPIVKVYK